MDSAITRGYLVLADISGFTSFVAKTELDHSRSILDEIFRLILGNFSPTLTIAEIEGDAVFAFARHDEMPRGEHLLEIIESTYVDFRNRQMSANRMTKCECRACEQSSTLDLKFMTHFGEFALQKATGRLKPLGSSVNVLHRLSKNGVTSGTGWRGYALFTKDSLDQMNVRPNHLYERTEEYEHLGAVPTYSINLDDRLKEFMEAREVIVDREHAHVTITQDYLVPAAVLWDWLNDPEKRQKWMINTYWEVRTRPDGRLSRGATNHCIKSGFIELILDWRPFSYYTVELVRGLIRIMVTTALAPAEGGTRLSWNARLESPLPSWLKKPVCALLISRGSKTKRSLARLSGILEGRMTPAGDLS